MDQRHYHSPVKPSSTRGRCPVCHEAAYSRAGIHPQCAIKQNDPPKPKAKAVTPALGEPVAQVAAMVEIGVASI
jgi:hypothetical protein